MSYQQCTRFWTTLDFDRDDDDDDDDDERMNFNVA